MKHLLFLALIFTSIFVGCTDGTKELKLTDNESEEPTPETPEEPEEPEEPFVCDGLVLPVEGDCFRLTEGWEIQQVRSGVTVGCLDISSLDFDLSDSLSIGISKLMEELIVIRINDQGAYVIGHVVNDEQVLHSDEILFDTFLSRFYTIDTCVTYHEIIKKYRLGNVDGDMSFAWWDQYMFRMDGLLDLIDSESITRWTMRGDSDMEMCLLSNGQTYIYGTTQVVRHENCVGSCLAFSGQDFLFDVFIEMQFINSENDIDYFIITPRGREFQNPLDITHFIDIVSKLNDDGVAFHMGLGILGAKSVLGGISGTGWMMFEHHFEGTIYGDLDTYRPSSDMLFDLEEIVE